MNTEDLFPSADKDELGKRLLYKFIKKSTGRYHCSFCHKLLPKNTKSLLVPNHVCRVVRVCCSCLVTLLK